MHRKSVALFTFLAMAMARPALAQSAQQLLSACRPIANGEVVEDGVKFARTYDTGLCWGTFAMLQLVIRHVDEKRHPPYNVCAPEASTRSQLVQVFVKFAAASPERLHEDGARMALESLQIAFPCRPAKP